MNKLTRQLYERANYRCEICGSTQGLQKHHIVKRSQGGDNCLNNLILLCWECHHGTRGVHGKEGHELDLELKLKRQQQLFDKDYSEKEVREKMGGKLYIEE